jgi:DNA-directed RNA polymerase specialized sigma24 family protein
MEHRNLNWSERTETLQVDKLLASRYSRLVQWATVLTRGDKSKADDVVQEFCLYISLVKPDLSDVANLDGYFYICLRHIYLSSLTRASREALQLVSIEDFG